MRLLLLVLTFQVSLVMSVAQATIIPLENYIQYDQDNDGTYDFDIVWASSWAFQFYGCDGAIDNQDQYLTEEYVGDVACSNQLFARGYLDDSWLFFEEIDNFDVTVVNTLFNNGQFSDDVNGGYITAFSFWNTNINLLPAVNPFTYNVISDWTSIDPVGIDPFTSDDIYFSNVFYARASQPVPEPSTMIIFALGLIALVTKKRLLR